MSASPEPLRTAICVSSWLPASETFIYDQLVHQVRTKARVIAREKTPFAARFPYDDVIKLRGWERATFYHTGIAPTVTRALEDYGTQLVHAHFGPNGTLMLPFAKKLEVPLVVSFHGHDVGGLEHQNRRTPRYHRYQRLAPRLFKYSSLLLCASEELGSLLVRHGAPEEKVRLHHLGVDIDRFVADPKRPREVARILMVGRLVEKKGTCDGIEAFARVTRRFPEATLRIAGDGPLRDDLIRQAEQLGVNEKITFLGSISSQAVLREMQRASILLTPSFTTPRGDRESGVIVIKEAGATGLVTVATRHGGIPEIIEDGRSGFMVPERDVDSLADRLIRLLKNPDLRAEMGIFARTLVERRYDSKKQNELLEEHLLRVASA